MAENSGAEGSRARLRDAFERVSADLQALPESALTRVNLDVPTAVGTILGALPKIRGFRGQIAAELVRYDLGLFDKLEDYTLALAYAHGAYLVASQAPRSLEELGAEGMQLRDVLLADASAQAARGLHRATPPFCPPASATAIDTS